MAALRWRAMYPAQLLVSYNKKHVLIIQPHMPLIELLNFLVRAAGMTCAYPINMAYIIYIFMDSSDT